MVKVKSVLRSGTEAIRTQIQSSKQFTDRSKAVVLFWFSDACFGVRVSVTFHIMCVHIMFISVCLLSGHWGLKHFLRRQSHPQFLKWYKTCNWLFGSHDNPLTRK